MTLRRLDPRIAAALWVGLIYASIPFVRQVREAFTTRWSAEPIGLAVVVILIGAAVISVIAFRRRQRRLSTADHIWLIAVTVVAIFWTSRLMGQPEEAVHLLEYGILGFLLYRALAKRFPDPAVYGAAVLVGLLVGTVDEIIQWLVPGRFWDFRDIVLNGGAVALVQAAIWRLVDRPPSRVGAASLRLLCRLAAALVCLLSVCLALTPQRLNRLADHFPLPQRLATGADAICEYGYRHAVDDHTAFRSRLSLHQLAKSDIAQAATVAGQLEAALMSRGQRRAFNSPVHNPFGYEVQVHIFARNRNLHRAREQGPGSVVYRQFMTIAWREHLILEKIFGNTMAQTRFRWRPRVRAEVEGAQDPEAFFVSRVGAHLITRISESQLRLVMLALLAVLVTCGSYLSTRSQPEAPPE
jgi:hypothetical protein